MLVLLAKHAGGDAGNTPEGARKMRRVAVAESLCDIDDFHAGVSQHTFGNVETSLIQQR